MVRLLFVVVVLALTVQSDAAEFTYPTLPLSGASLSEFVPDGWGLMAEVEGDLNKDGRSDIAAIMELQEAVAHESDCELLTTQLNAPPLILNAAPRILFIVLATNTGYRLSANDTNVVMRADQGGIWGDPFQSLDVVNGSVVLSHYGGSAWRWGRVERFRFQDDDWFLVGYTESSHHTASQRASEYDYNLSTGRLRTSTTDAEGLPGCRRCLRNEACPTSEGCYRGETQAQKKVTWMTVSRSRRLRLSQTLCNRIDVLPFVFQK